MKTDGKKGRDLRETNIDVEKEGINDVTKSARDVIRNQSADQKGMIGIGDIYLIYQSVVYFLIPLIKLLGCDICIRTIA